MRSRWAVKFCSIQLCYRLVVGKRVCIGSVSARRHKNTSGGSLLLNHGAEVPDGTHVNCIRVALRLNDVFPSMDRVRVKNDGIYTPVPACLRDLYLCSSAGELFLK